MKPLSEIFNNVQNAATPEGGGRRLVRTTSCPSAISQLASDLPFNPRDERAKTAIDPPPSSNYTQSLSMPKEQSTSIEPPAGRSEDGEEPCRNRKRSCSEDEEQQGVEKENETIVGRPQKRAKDVAVEVKPKQRSAASSNTANDPPPVPVDKSEATTKTNMKKRSRKRPSSTGGETTTTTRPVKKSSKQQSSAIQTWKRNAINGRHRNLLSSFVTYEDQLPPTPTTASYERVSMQSPSSRGGDRQSLSRRSSTDDSLLDAYVYTGFRYCRSITIIKSVEVQNYTKQLRKANNRVEIILYHLLIAIIYLPMPNLVWREIE